MSIQTLKNELLTFVKDNQNLFYDEASQNIYINKIKKASSQLKLIQIQSELKDLKKNKRIFKIEKPEKINELRQRILNKLETLTFKTKTFKNFVIELINKSKTKKLNDIEIVINKLPDEPITKKIFENQFDKILKESKKVNKISEDVKMTEYVMTFDKYTKALLKIKEDNKNNDIEKTENQNDYIKSRFYKKIKSMSDRNPKNIIRVVHKAEDPEDPTTEDLNENINLLDRKTIKSNAKLNGVLYPIFWLNSSTTRIFNYYYKETLINKVTDSGIEYTETNYIPRNQSKRVYVRIYSIPKIPKITDTEQKRILQRFEESDDILKCVPKALYNFFYNKNLDNVAQSYIKRFTTDKGKFKYNKPYSLEELNELAKEMNISITITDFINNNIKVNEDKNNRYNVTLLNTKYNHLEYIDMNPVIINNNDLYKIINNADYYYISNLFAIANNKYYQFEETKTIQLYNSHLKSYNLNRNKIMIDSEESKYIDNYYMSIHQIFNIDLYDKYIDDVKNIKYDESLEESLDPLDEGINLNVYKSNQLTGYLNKIKEYEQNNYKEVDLIKAYYNLTNKNIYGFPSNAFIYYKNPNYLEHIENKWVGYYEIEIIEDNEKLKMIGFYKSSVHTITTPQLMVLHNNNIKYKVLSALVSPSIDFKLDESTLEKENKIYIYCKMVGLLISGKSSAVKIKTPNPEQYLNMLNIEESKNVFIDENNIINIIKERKTTLKHIGYFIHSLTSSKVLDLLLNNDINDILGVKLDSIIVKKEANIKYNPEYFRIKEEPKIYELTDLNDGYIKPYIEEKKEETNCNELILNNWLITNKIIFLSGPGGTGKTHSIMQNIPAYRICYSSLSWDRCIDFKNKAGDVQILSLNKLIGDNCEQKPLRPSVGFIIIDELTLINKSIIDKIISLYPDKIIFLLGDITFDGFYYQCSLENLPGEKHFEVIKPKDYNLQFIEYTKNYRFTEELNIKLLSFRNLMETIIKSKNNDKTKASILYNYIRKEFKDNFKSIDEIIYNDRDIGVSDLDDKKQGFKLTNIFLRKGAKPRYYINKTMYDQGIIKGQIFNEKPTHKYYDVRLFTTVHSCQGYTLDNDQKIIISIEKNFDLRLLYTALSRARRLEQIVFIEY